jgi:hypothetical protein
MKRLFIVEIPKDGGKAEISHGIVSAIIAEEIDIATRENNTVLVAEVGPIPTLMRLEDAVLLMDPVKSRIFTNRELSKIPERAITLSTSNAFTAKISCELDLSVVMAKSWKKQYGNKNINFIRQAKEMYESIKIAGQPTFEEAIRLETEPLAEILMLTHRGLEKEIDTENPTEVFEDLIKDLLKMLSNPPKNKH